MYIIEIKKNEKEYMKKYKADPYSYIDWLFYLMSLEVSNVITHDTFIMFVDRFYMWK